MITQILFLMLAGYSFIRGIFLTESTIISTVYHIVGYVCIYFFFIAEEWRERRHK